MNLAFMSSDRDVSKGGLLWLNWKTMAKGVIMGELAE